MTRRPAVAAFLLVATGSVLGLAAPSPAALLAAMRDPSGWVGTDGVDAAVLTLAVGMCWLMLGWLALGLALGLAGQLPGAAGRTARAVGTAVLPPAIRQLVALTLGVGLVTAGASSAAANPDPAVPGGAASSADAALDWPVRPSASTEEPPAAAGPPSSPGVDGVVVVRSGDCLWELAADRLGREASAGQIATAVAGWYRFNRDIIGPDPDLIHPGQRLLPPPPPASSAP